MRDGKSIKSYVKYNIFVAPKICLMRWARYFVLGRWVVVGLRRGVITGGVRGAGGAGGVAKKIFFDFFCFAKWSEID